MHLNAMWRTTQTLTFWSGKLLSCFIMLQFMIILTSCHLSDSYIKLTIYPVERNIVVKENADLNVTCKLSTTFGIQDHASFMSWTLPMKKNDTENRVFVHRSHNERTVTINKIRASDSGEYICELKNGFTLMQKMIHIRTDTDERLCPKSKFPCGNNQCIPRHYVCDGHKDCKDDSDESFSICGYNVCKEKIWCDERCISASLCCDPMTQPNCSANYLMPCCSRFINNHLAPIDENIPIQYKYQNIGFYQSTVYTMISCAIAFIFMSTVMLVAVCRFRMRYTPWFLPSSQTNEQSQLWRGFFSQNRRQANVSDLRTRAHFPPHLDQSEISDPTENFVLLTFNSDTGFEIAEYGPKPPPYTENNIGVPPPPYSSVQSLVDPNLLPSDVTLSPPPPLEASETVVEPSSESRATIQS